MCVYIYTHTYVSKLSTCEVAIQVCYINLIFVYEQVVCSRVDTFHRELGTLVHANVIHINDNTNNLHHPCVHIVYERQRVWSALPASCTCVYMRIFVHSYEIYTFFQKLVGLVYVGFASVRHDSSRVPGFLTWWPEVQSQNCLTSDLIVHFSLCCLNKLLDASVQETLHGVVFLETYCVGSC
jgi:hypothetical protein